MPASRNPHPLQTLLDAAAHNMPWWKDERSRHCAYCGIMMGTREGCKELFKKTHDHIIPVAQNGPGVTIPACFGCNREKADKSLPEFLKSRYFKRKRKVKHGKAWPESELWAAFCIAALRKTAELLATDARQKPKASKASIKPPKAAVNASGSVPSSPPRGPKV
jgi:hypothetical protein